MRGRGRKFQNVWYCWYYDCQVCLLNKNMKSKKKIKHFYFNVKKSINVNFDSWGGMLTNCRFSFHFDQAGQLRRRTVEDNFIQFNCVCKKLVYNFKMCGIAGIIIVSSFF